MKVVIISGGFDPLHSGHIAYIDAARALGDMLIVGVNSDEWLSRKKGKPFLSFEERVNILRSLSKVDIVAQFDDSDGTAIDLIRKVKQEYPNDELIFANGGDRTATNIPELTEKGVIFKFGVGGDHKMNSSSDILREWKSTKVQRDWGHYETLYETARNKIKILTIHPESSLSNQVHMMRDEYWHVLSGTVQVNIKDERGRWLIETREIVSAGENIHIPACVWHQCMNTSKNVPAVILEIQSGTCDENDIRRANASE